MAFKSPKQKRKEKRTQEQEQEQEKPQPAKRPKTKKTYRQRRDEKRAEEEAERARDAELVAKAKAKRKHRASANTYEFAKDQRTGERVIEDNLCSIIRTDIPPGDARVTIGHDMKDWASFDYSGMTIGSVCSVTLPCAPDVESMDAAAEVAQQRAFSYLEQSHDRIASLLEDFLEKDK